VKIIILPRLLGTSGVANYSPSQEDLYSSPCEDFKSIPARFRNYGALKEGVPNCKAVSSSSRTLVVYGSDDYSEKHKMQIMLVY
jgi:hypothetical protein